MTGRGDEILLSTALGDLTFLLETRRAPASSRYFLQGVRDGVYDGTSFYRITTPTNQDAGTAAPIEIAQGGCRQPIAPIAPSIVHETTRRTGLRHRRGAISLARFAPGAVYNSFFLCRSDAPELDHGGARQPDGLGFAAFGALIAGDDALDRIFARAEATEALRDEITIFRIVAR